MGDSSKRAAGSSAALVSSALELAGDGRPVLPLRPHGKRPLAGLGLHHATTGTSVVAGWWQRWPTANVGMRADGLCVVDVDGAAGEQSLHELQRRYGLLPATRAAKTGKGRHLLYATNGAVVGNSTRGLGSPPGIDLRGGPRGYIVCPPSVHASGRRYEWLDDRPAAPLPDAWLKPLTTIVVESRVAAAAKTGEETAYGRAALASELERLLSAREGERNEMLNLAAFRLGQLPEVIVERECLEVARMLGLGWNESRKTVHSGLVAGLSLPRTPLARAMMGIRDRRIGTLLVDIRGNCGLVW